MSYTEYRAKVQTRVVNHARVLTTSVKPHEVFPNGLVNTIRSWTVARKLRGKDGKTPLLEIKLLHCCFADPSLRQAIEAVIIKEEDPLLNRKEEWNNEPRKKRNKKLMTSGSNVTSSRDVTSHGWRSIVLTLTWQYNESLSLVSYHCEQDTEVSKLLVNKKVLEINEW